jgi:hypothetical protein
MDALIGDRFLKRFLKGVRPGSKTGSTAAAALQDTENTQGPAWDDETCEDLTRDDGESHNEPPTPGKKGSIGPLPELPEGTEVNGGK